MSSDFAPLLFHRAVNTTLLLGSVNNMSNSSLVLRFDWLILPEGAGHTNWDSASTHRTTYQSNPVLQLRRAATRSHRRQPAYHYF